MGKRAVALEQAEKEVTSWLDHKRIKDKKRLAYKEAIDELIEGIEYGDLSLDPKTFVFTQKLSFPLGDGDNSIKTLEYKPRVSVGSFHNHLRGIKGDDADGRIIAYVTGLTGQLKALIGKMDGVDYDVSKAIAVFFL